MTHARYTPQMVVATVCVLFVPAAVVSILHAHGRVTSFWVCAALALGLTFLALTIGTSYWRRRRPPASVLFSDLMVWAWIRDQYVNHKLAATLRSLDRLRPEDVEQRRELLGEIAAAVEAKDPFLTGHSQRVARYVTAVVRRMGIEQPEARRIRTAALLHDVGKLHTPTEILMSRSKLSGEDTAVMRRHADDGAEMVATLSDSDLADIVRHHHERFDGSGYPSGLAGEAIPLGARIIAVPDTFDAITSTRPYRAGLPHLAALAVLREEAGGQFDPAVVRAFIAEYTDRRGVMTWAAAGQIASLFRVAGVASAAIVLNAFTFVASTPSSVNPPPRTVVARPVQQTSGPLGTASLVPAPQSGPARRPAADRSHRPARPSTATAPGSQPAAFAQATQTQPAPRQAGAGAQPSTQRSPPVYPAQGARPSPPGVALAPQTSAAFRSVGTGIDQGTSALTDAPAPATAPTSTTTSPTTTSPTTTSPTTGTAPVSPTQPAAPPAGTSPITPTPPENADQCKNDGWKNLGFENQGQCMASIRNG